MVDLTARQQSLIAECCTAIRTALYDFKTDRKCFDDISSTLLYDLNDVAERFDATPQTFDQLYDIMHRTGQNV